MESSKEVAKRGCQEVAIYYTPTYQIEDNKTTLKVEFGFKVLDTTPSFPEPDWNIYKWTWVDEVCFFIKSLRLFLGLLLFYIVGMTILYILAILTNH